MRQFGPITSVLAGLKAHALARVRSLEGASGHGLLVNFSWYGLAELCSRLSRLLSTIILARLLGATELGVAATALATFEIVRVLANNGVGQMLVRAESSKLDALASAAYRAGWYVCGAMLVLQLASGIIVAHNTGRPELFWMIASLSGVFLLIPHGLVQSYLLQRDNNIKALAKITATQIMLENALTAILAIAGMGGWAIVLPKLLTAPVWTLSMRSARPWSINTAVAPTATRELFNYAAPILASEMVIALRGNVDKLMVGAILGVEALGLYYFAFNAGVGISMTLTQALSQTLYPHLAAVAHDLKAMLARFDAGFARMGLAISALIALQALSTFVYVPIVFGAHWAPATAIVAMLCASAISKPAYDSATQLLRASGFTLFELAASIMLALITLGVFRLMLPLGLVTGVAALAATTFALQIVVALVARQIVSSAAYPQGPDAGLPEPTFRGARP